MGIFKKSHSNIVINGNVTITADKTKTANAPSLFFSFHNVHENPTVYRNTQRKIKPKRIFTLIPHLLQTWHSCLFPKFTKFYGNLYIDVCIGIGFHPVKFFIFFQCLKQFPRVLRNHKR